MKDHAEGNPISAPASKAFLSIADLVAAFLEHREKQDSHITFRSLRWGLGFLVEKYGKLSPSALTPDLIAAWIPSLPLQTRAKFNVFAAGRTFFNWRMVKNLKEKNPFQDAPPKKDKGHRLPILTPDQMRAILGAEFPSFFRAWIVGGGFAGLRTIEMDRLDRSAIDRENKEITVRKDQSKQGEAARPRSITTQEAFLRHMPAGEGKWCEGAKKRDFEAEMPRLLQIIGLESWPSNTLRHSFASYHLANYRDASKTAYEMGHVSANMVYSTYANSVSRKDAEAWWAI